MLYPIIKSQITKVNNRKFLTQSPMQIQVIYFTLAKDKQQQSTAESILHNHTCKFNHSPSVILHPITKCQIAKVYNRKYCTHSLSHMQVQVLSHCYTAPSSLNGNIILIWCLLHIYLAAWMQCSLSPLMFTMHWHHHSPASPKRFISATSSFSKKMRRLPYVCAFFKSCGISISTVSWARNHDKSP